MMKKIYPDFFVPLVFLILGIQLGYAQNGAALEKSIASISNYIDMPVNEASGIPNINIPLLSIPMADNNINYPISLRYNVRNYNNIRGVSDIGQGWSLFGTSIIYRDIQSVEVECDRINNQYDPYESTYYYNVLDLSGKFTVKKDTNGYKVVNLNPNNNITIEINNSIMATGLEFAIITNNGYRYSFNNIDNYQFKCNNYPKPSGVASTYYLAKIFTPTGVEVATFDYQLQNKNVPSQMAQQYCKLKSIKTVKGEVNFTFIYDESLENTVNDPYWLKEITLKNPSGEVQYSYVMNSYISAFPSSDVWGRKRILNFIRKNDKNNLKIEQTVFGYENSAQSGNQEGILEKITTPAGGIAEYKYEDHVYTNSASAAGNIAKRVKVINYYKNSIDIAPERTINYDYNLFGTTTSSGYKYYGEIDEYNEQKQVSYILYKNVKVWETGKGYTQKTFITPNDYPKYLTNQIYVNYYYFWPYYDITRWGLPSKEEVYDDQNRLLSQKETNYFFDQYWESQYDFKIHPEYSVFISEHISSKRSYILKTLQTEKEFYANNQSITKETEVSINAINLKPGYIKSVVNGKVKEKSITYPTNLPGYSHLESAHMIGVPVSVEEKEDGKLLARSKVLFNNGSLLPTSVLATNIEDENTKEIQKMDSYDYKGNLIQLSNAAGVKTAMIYGYNKSLIIAKVQGAAYDQVWNLAQDFIDASDVDNNAGTQASEEALLSAMNTFRKKPGLSNFQITTYTYDPLVGIRSMTPPSGVTEYYIYDNTGRLHSVKDKDGNIIKDYQYRYKNYKD
ncbi:MULTISPECIES: hypothetical protein [unclassified Chryseobacterium]|uniref:hypothetical protein n=1 Tax=unclassified Chryseobacterium TaxID=2593645 RepID=UPI0028533B8A|nr:hypothetical protein [Chryseobacterium sp. CFS7]MDR4892806.1 hypothetical protein [Chryseobacterium sp. CFS7]